MATATAASLATMVEIADQLLAHFEDASDWVIRELAAAYR